MHHRRRRRSLRRCRPFLPLHPHPLRTSRGCDALFPGWPRDHPACPSARGRGPGTPPHTTLGCRWAVHRTQMGCAPYAGVRAIHGIHGRTVFWVGVGPWAYGDGGVGALPRRRRVPHCCAVGRGALRDVSDVSNVGIPTCACVGVGWAWPDVRHQHHERHDSHMRHVSMRAHIGSYHSKIGSAGRRNAKKWRPVRYLKTQQA